MPRPTHNASRLDTVLGHWLWAVPSLLVVALFAFQKINTHAPSPDEFLTMINVGWVADGPFSPIDVLESLARRSPQQAPLYYWLLNLWGSLVPQDIALARVLSVFFGLLFMATCFRLVRDFVAPVCGPIAIAIIASNAFLNLYLPYARMYTIYLLAAAMALWTYLRIMYRLSRPSRRDYLAFSLTCLALAGTIASSIFVFAAVGAFHLLCAPKGLRRLRIILCVAIALLLYSPWALVQHYLGSSRFFLLNLHQTSNTMDVLKSLTELMSNGSMVLLLIPMTALAIAWRQRHIALPSHYLLLGFYVIVVIITEQTIGLFSILRLRYVLPGIIMLLLVQTASLYALYRIRRWLSLLALLWIVAGISYHAHRSADGWKPEADDRAYGLEQAPYHEIGQHARRAGSEADIYAYRTNSRNLRTGRPGMGRLLDRYFDLDRVSYTDVQSLHGVNVHMSWNSLTAPSVWLYYQTSKIDAAEAGALDDVLKSFHYERCQEMEFALDTVLVKYWWTSLSCRAPQPLVSADTSLIEYQFLGARQIDSGRSLAFSDKWMAKTGASAEQYKMSYQLINEDWENVAQLDLPLVDEGIPRQFTIDIRRAPAGQYRLTAVLYELESGVRLKWSESEEFVPEMLTLEEIEL